MKIALIGYGKMGKAIEHIALEQGHQIVLRIHSGNREEFTKENIQKANVCIEFTNPEAAIDNIIKCIDAGVPVVCGSTGWWHHLPQVLDFCKEKNGSFLYASNFSIGVNIFFKINDILAHIMNSYTQYNVSIEEIHHTAKKDAPSGTAISLAQGILKQVTHKKQWVNEKSDSKEDLSIISKREDPAPGTHIVRYESDIDTIQIEHIAHNRIGFATGAILASFFIHDKKGIFTMKDVLNL